MAQCRTCLRFMKEEDATTASQSLLVIFPLVRPMTSLNAPFGSFKVPCHLVFIDQMVNDLMVHQLCRGKQEKCGILPVWTLWHPPTGFLQSELWQMMLATQESEVH